MIVCKFCEKQYSKMGIGTHLVRCKLNPDRKPHSKKWHDARASDRGRKGTNQYTKAKRLGLPKPVITDETREKHSVHSRQIPWDDERRKRHSETMREAVKNHPDSYSKNNVCGRVKNIQYNGQILKGSWEVIVAMWLDHNDIEWVSEPEGFDYIWEEKKHTYFPDFYIKEYNVYLEVKGYQRDRDIAKWNAFPHKLVVINKDIIYNINELTIEELIKKKQWDIS